MFDKFQKVYKKVISQQSLDKFESTFNQPEYKGMGKTFYDSVDSNISKENLEMFFNPENIRLWKKLLDLERFQSNNTQFIMFSNADLNPRLLAYLKGSVQQQSNGLPNLKFGNNFVAINQDGNDILILELFHQAYDMNPFTHSMVDDEILVPLLKAQWRAISRQEYQAL